MTTPRSSMLNVRATSALPVSAISLPLDKPTVLVVQDDPYVSTILWTLLKKFDFNVVCEMSGSEALAKVRRLAPDVIVLDVDLPEMNGLEICRRLKAKPETSAVPVVFFSDECHLAQDALILGASAFLRKPVDVGKLPDCLRQILAGSDSAIPAATLPV